eukprot:CAMPEP_0113872012 /NCGR_PEP_ID=MMETSP0780_2-20120614/2961_1 /TAXON_ID=652834 /ORGANISM="Palpitomonas bilix" /LENGTH=164 /DNA_ID=CAMNT_0000857465 /DNA_START=131 /DNA_END=624 /DNA_ORIENTATION=- /assembly_acc=CAM_ASM_000599
MTKALQKYKAQLLGAAASGQATFGSADDPNVQMLKLIIERQGAPTLEFDLQSESSREDLKKGGFVLKEGCTYTVKLSFRVNREVVLGLAVYNTVKKGAIKVLKDKGMIGSYGPQLDPITFSFGSNEAPKGVLGRGNYSAKMTFFDDDKNVYSDLPYLFSVKKDF